MYKRGERQDNQLINVHKKDRVNKRGESTNWLMYTRGERQVNQLINVQERWKTSQPTD